MADKSKDRGGKDKKTAKAAKVKDPKAPAVSVPESPKAKKTELGTSVVAPCTCTHADQDAFHGKGYRVFNVGSQQRTCTVCGAHR